MDKRLVIAAVLYPIVQAVLFGSSVVIIAAGFADFAASLLPHAVIFSLVMAAPLAWDLAPSLSLELSAARKPVPVKARRR